MSKFSVFIQLVFVVLPVGCGKLSTPYGTHIPVAHLSYVSLAEDYQDQDLISSWRFQNPYGSKSAKNQIGSEPIFFASGGPNNHPFARLDGVNSFLSISNEDVFLNKTFTIFFVIRHTQDPFTFNSSIISKGNGSDQWRILTTTDGGNNTYAYNIESSESGNQNGTLDEMSSTPPNVWHIKALRITHSQLQSFHAGEKVGDITFLNLPNISRDLIIGAYELSPNNFALHGKFDLAELLIYNSALSDSKMKEVHCQLHTSHQLSLNITCP